MTDWTTARVTPEMQAELRRLYEAAFSVAAPENDWEEWTSKAADAFPALLDAAAERDRLAGLLDEPRRSGCAVEIAGVRIAPCDERGQTADMCALAAAADRLAHMREARDNSRAEVERLTDERDALAAAVERVRALADWHETKADKARRFRIEINGENRVMDKAAEVHDDAARRLRRALDGGAES